MIKVGKERKEKKIKKGKQRKRKQPPCIKNIERLSRRSPELGIKAKLTIKDAIWRQKKRHLKQLVYRYKNIYTESRRT